MVQSLGAIRQRASMAAPASASRMEATVPTLELGLNCTGTLKTLAAPCGSSASASAHRGPARARQPYDHRAVGGEMRSIDVGRRQIAGVQPARFEPRPDGVDIRDARAAHHAVRCAHTSRLAHSRFSRPPVSSAPRSAHQPPWPAQRQI